VQPQGYEGTEGCWDLAHMNCGREQHPRALPPSLHQQYSITSLPYTHKLALVRHYPNILGYKAS